IVLLHGFHPGAEPPRARGAPRLLPALAAARSVAPMIGRWRRERPAAGSGTERPGAASEPSNRDGAGRGDADPGGAEREPADLGAAMTSACAADPFSRALADREALIRLCLYALDRARSSGVAERLTEG